MDSTFSLLDRSQTFHSQGAPQLIPSLQPQGETEVRISECLSFPPQKSMILFADLGKVTFMTFCCVLRCHSCHSHCQEQKERKKQPLLKWDVCKNCFYNIILNAIQVAKGSIYVTLLQKFHSGDSNWIEKLKISLENSLQCLGTAACKY